MTTPLNNRVSILENEVKTQKEIFGKDIHAIKTNVEHIESDMSELKNITKNNTNANLKTNATLTDIHLTLMEYRGGFKVAVWIIGAVGGLTGLMALISTLAKLNAS